MKKKTNFLKVSALTLGVFLIGAFVFVSVNGSSSSEDLAGESVSSTVIFADNSVDFEGKCGESEKSEKKAKSSKKSKKGEAAATEGEGKCGEGKCGEGKSEGTEKPEAETETKEGAAKTESKSEGKCGEGKCGGA